MNDINFHSCNTNFGKVGVHRVIEILGLIRMNKPDPTFDDFHHSKIGH